jgi:hypothetical protein
VFVVSFTHAPPHAARPAEHCTVAAPLACAEAPVAASLTVTWIVTAPGAAYVCVPLTVKEPADPVIVPLDVVPSPQVTTAARALGPSPAIASMTSATAPEHAAPAVAVTASTDAESCVLQTLAMHVLPDAHAYADPHPPQFESSLVSSTHLPLHAVGVEPPHVAAQA